MLSQLPLWGQTQITVSPETRHQTMVGFGGALTWYSNRIYNSPDPAVHDEILNYLFVDSGIDVVRLKNWYFPIGYPAVTDPTTGAWGDKTNHGTTSQIYHAAKALNPDIQVLLSSWGPPAVLKSNGQRENGGTLKKDANGNYMYAELAQYYADMLDNQDWSPDYLSFQNEPGWVASWDSCEFKPTETATKAGYIEAADAIWNKIKDRPDAPKMLGSEGENTSAFFSLNPEVQNRDYFSAHGYHIYDINVSQIDSSKSKLNKIRDDFSDLPNWMTEFSKHTYDWLDAARIIHNTVVDANASAYIYWTLGWGPPPTDDNGIPTEASHSMIELNGDGSYKINPHYYTVKHFAKHVDKGYQRISIGGSTNDVRISGYLSDDQSKITLVAVNRTAAASNIQLSNSNFSISTIEGYQSTVGSYYQTMTGLNAANAIALPAESITTIVLTLSEPFNVEPVANDASLTTETNTELSLVLGASDAENSDLTYSIVAGPSNGSLSGTAPNLTYTPTSDYQGADSFTFKVNDGTADSNIATVSITITQGGITTIAVTGATSFSYNGSGLGPDTSTVTGSAGSVAYSYSGTGGTSYGPSADKPIEAGIYQVVATVAADANYTGATSDPVPFLITSSQNLVTNGDYESGFDSGWNNLRGNGAAATYSADTADPYQGTTAFKVEVTTLGANSWDVQSMGPSPDLVVGEDYTVTFWAKAAVEGTQVKVVFQNTAYSGSNYTLGTSWAPYTTTFTAIEIAPQIRLQFPDLGTVWMDDIRLAHVNTAPTVSAGLDKTITIPAAGSGALDLNGSVSDADGHAVTTTWTVVGTPNTVTFANASAVDTTATFTAAGTYQIRLTADDSYDQAFDDLEVIVLADADSDGMPDTWETNYSLNASTGDATLDSDNDGVSNLDEYLAGTDPTDSTKQLKIISLTISQSGERAITWSSEQDGTTRARLYTLQRSSTLGPQDWVDVATNISPSGPTTVETDSDAVMPQKMFNRVIAN